MCAGECGGAAMWADVLAVTSPKIFEANEFSRDGIAGDTVMPIDASVVRGVFIEGPTFEGRPTRSFAWVGVPQGASQQNRVPAMVLVHGGGGTAYAGWVQLWLNRGYAAIAVDTCGQVPVGKYDQWQRHEHSGPAGWGGRDQIDWPVRDQWGFHAVSSVILANAAIRSLPGVDADRVGLTGISWGGYLTCLAAGIDSRLACAVPVYGSGFLDGESSFFRKDLDEMGLERAARWMTLWDPSTVLANVRCPMLWVNGTNDPYPMDSWQKSYRLPKSARTLTLIVRMLHGHGGWGERPQEIATFANSVMRGGDPLPKLSTPTVTGTTMQVTVESTTTIARAELNFTMDAGPWRKRNWATLPVSIDAHGVIRADLAKDMTGAYIHVIDARGNIVSCEHLSR